MCSTAFAEGSNKRANDLVSSLSIFVIYPCRGLFTGIL